MTPEERMWEIDLSGVGTDRDDFTRVRQNIASAIRAAENDALERAANALAELRHGDDDYITHMSAAFVVRELKHKVVE